MKIVNIEFTPPPPVLMTFEFSHREMIALHTLCRRVGGDQHNENSPRSMFDQIRFELEKMNVPYDSDLIDSKASPSFSSIHFKDWPAKYR